MNPANPDVNRSAGPVVGTEKIQLSDGKVKSVKARLGDYLRAKGITPNEQSLIRCPWHDDEHPSCKVNNEYLYCFSCGESGDIYGVAAALLGVPCDKWHFPEICRDITRVLGIPEKWQPDTEYRKSFYRKNRDCAGKQLPPLSKSAVFRNGLLTELAQAIDFGNMLRALEIACLLFAMFLLPEGEAVQPKPKRSMEDMLSSYGRRGERG
jgi:hypothetical protein